MRNDAIPLEEMRLKNVADVQEYESVHERHRIFPALFENRNHTEIIDIAAGVGVVGQRIKSHYHERVLCNDISPKCLSIMRNNGLRSISFDIDDPRTNFPFTTGRFDAVIALATIEHLIHIDHFVSEIHRILRDDGCFYVSAPNYSGVLYLLPFLLSGKTFHDPLSGGSRYEFYAHVRYFTYRTLLEFVASFGFRPDTVYLPLPQSSSRYAKLRARSKVAAGLFRQSMRALYALSPRWASEPVICFRKGPGWTGGHVRKVVL
jgi:SAM-dependent methyltransferase